MSDFQPYDPNEDSNSDGNKGRRSQPNSSAAPFPSQDADKTSSSADSRPRDFQPFSPDSFSQQQNDDSFNFNAANDNNPSSDSFQPFNQPSARSPFDQQSSDFSNDRPQDQPSESYFQRPEQRADDQQSFRGYQQPEQGSTTDTRDRYPQYDQQPASDFGRPVNSYNPNNYENSQTNRQQREGARQRTSNRIPKGAGPRLRRNSIVALVIAALIVLLAIPVIGSIVGGRRSNNSTVASSVVTSSKTSSSSSSQSSGSASSASSSTSSAPASSSSSTADDSSASSSSSSTAAAASYTVKAGDTPYSIARANNITVAELYQLNGLAVGSTLQPGQVLNVNGN